MVESSPQEKKEKVCEWTVIAIRGIALFFVALGVITALQILTTPAQGWPADMISALVVILLVLGFAAVSVVAGYGMWMLRKWGAWMLQGSFVFMMVMPPVGTILGIVGLLWSGTKRVERCFGVGPKLGFVGNLWRSLALIPVSLIAYSALWYTALANDILNS